MLHATYVLVKQGVVRPIRPDRLARMALAYRRWGITLPLGFAIGAIRHPDRPAVIDERGALSYAELSQRTTRLADALRDRVPAGTRIGLLTRNHHGTVEVIVAAAKLGVDVVLLNTGLSSKQLADVLEQQDVTLLVADEEFTTIRERLRGSAVEEPDTAGVGISARELAAYLAGQYPDAEWSRTDHYAWIVSLLGELDITSLGELGGVLADVDEGPDGPIARLDYRYPPGAVRRLDDALLATYGERYVALPGNAHRVPLLQARLERMRG